MPLELRVFFFNAIPITKRKTEKILKSFGQQTNRKIFSIQTSYNIKKKSQLYAREKKILNVRKLKKGQKMVFKRRSSQN